MPLLLGGKAEGAVRLLLEASTLVRDHAVPEAARLVGSFVFGTLGTHRLEARVLLQHGRANGALRKLGAVQEGVLRRSVRRDDNYFDQVLWSLLRDDWGDHWVPIGPRVH